MKKRTAFTFVELLVVIAILAILAGMLFPAIEIYREKHRKQIEPNQEMRVGNNTALSFRENTGTGYADDVESIQSILNQLKTFEQHRSNIFITSVQLISKGDKIRWALIHHVPKAPPSSVALEKSN